VADLSGQFDRLLDPRLVHVRAADQRAFRGEATSGFPPNARGRAGHQRDAAYKTSNFLSHAYIASLSAAVHGGKGDIVDYLKLNSESMMSPERAISSRPFLRSALQTLLELHHLPSNRGTTI
jgi:hypothetical protein